jgi:hypothetical protein
MRKRLLIFFSIFLTCSVSAYSQFYYSGLSSSFDFPRTKYVVDSTGNLRFKPGDLGVSVQVGTGFGSNFHGNSSFYTFASPSLAYNLTPRFRLKTGVTVFNNFGSPLNTGYDPYYSPVMPNGTTTSVFVQGDYLLNNKLTLSGALYKDFSTFNIHSTDPRFKPPESQGMILNLNYRPTSSVEINASFGYGSGNRSMFHDPFYHNSMFPGNYPW